jgi:hypothetical protein
MITKRQQILINELKDIISINGYWSNEVRNFNKNLSYNDLHLINSIARQIK